jgi:hypothetical protein
MADELARLWGNFSLSVEESIDEDLLEEEVIKISAKGKF